MADWDACLARARPSPISGCLFRLVESQEEIATNQLVSSLERQSVLEEMLESTKPPLRQGTQRLHYLLATPFRYPPLKYGSRFGTRAEPSLFYGSLGLPTVLAEAAYYRFVFWRGMTVPPRGKLDTQHTLLTSEYRTQLGLRLQEPPFDVVKDLLTAPDDYRTTQALGSKMRVAGIEAFEFPSARDPDGGINVALYTPDAFPNDGPSSTEPWMCELTGTHAKFSARRGRLVHDFPIEMFYVSASFPRPA